MTADLIARRRRQIFVHSAIYYRLGTSVIDDATFDRWGRESSCNVCLRSKAQRLR
ncbi:DNA ligase LigA-related protein [Paenibacillus agricola]|uniref:DNA ligase LigA-related protein n=1 Tax=Paenibacillus agricola TaxID=2716264 RepID=UPI0035D3FC73